MNDTTTLSPTACTGNQLSDTDRNIIITLACYLALVLDCEHVRVDR